MQTLYDREEVVYAGFFSRLAAFFLDSVLVGIGLWIVKIPVWFVELAVGDTFLFQPILFQYNMFDILYYLLGITYFVLMTYFCGATVGKTLMRIRVADVQGEKLTFMSVLIRETVGKYLSAVIIYIGYIIAGFDNRKQSLHDKIADTCVVYKHKVRVQTARPMPPQQVPVSPMPTQQRPVQQMPTQTVPVQQMPTQQVPMQQMSMQSRATQTVPVQQMSAQSVSTQPVPEQETAPISVQPVVETQSMEKVDSE